MILKNHLTKVTAILTCTFSVQHLNASNIISQRDSSIKMGQVMILFQHFEHSSNSISRDEELAPASLQQQKGQKRACDVARLNN
jgi:hypothetical protein